MNLLQYIFPQAENLVFQFPKSRGRIFLCVSPTFASPIEKPATSALRRICREIIGNTEGNAKTVDSLRHCKKTSSDSKSAPKTKKPTRRPVGGEFSKWCRWRRYWTNFSPLPQNANFPTPSRWGCPPSRKFLREIRKNSHNLKIGFVYRKNALKRIRTCDLYLRLEMNYNGWTKVDLHYSSTSCSE